MRLFLILFSLLLLSCDKKQTSHPVFDYYPNQEIFEEGYVNKYYFHYYPDNPDASSATEIRYTKYIKLNENQFKTEGYNAGFELVNNRFYNVKEDTIRLEKGIGINRTDTIPLDLINPITSVWNDSPNYTPYQVRFESNDKKYVYTEYQKSVYDSLIIDKPAKVFFNEWYYQEEGKDSLFNQGSSKSYYVADLGFFGDDDDGSTYKRKLELIEQMFVAEFEKRANHGKHRIGYIDPASTLSDDSNFKICGHEERIMDYYNLDPNAEYKYGKRAMRNIILEQLNTEKLKGQSGMLTFRFVINCKGEAGRFVTNGVDFDFQKKEFSEKCVNHLLSILQGLKTWQNLETKDGETRDAYAYITFKIKDEEIIDILP
jgi:hypothetical protein